MGNELQNNDEITAKFTKRIAELESANRQFNSEVNALNHHLAQREKEINSLVTRITNNEASYNSKLDDLMAELEARGKAYVILCIVKSL